MGVLCRSHGTDHLVSRLTLKPDTSSSIKELFHLSGYITKSSRGAKDNRICLHDICRSYKRNVQDQSFYAAGGNPYGTSVSVDQDGKMKEDVKGVAIYQAKRVVDVAGWLKKGMGM